VEVIRAAAGDPPIVVLTGTDHEGNQAEVAGRYQ
jgi:hypothetical protein